MFHWSTILDENASTNLRPLPPGPFQEPTWARFGAENTPRTKFHRSGIVFNRFWKKFGTMFDNIWKICQWLAKVWSTENYKSRQINKAKSSNHADASKFRPGGVRACDQPPLALPGSGVPSQNSKYQISFIKFHDAIPPPSSSPPAAPRIPQGRPQSSVDFAFGILLAAFFRFLAAFFWFWVVFWAP